jgi:hypothetical protein
LCRCLCSAKHIYAVTWLDFREYLKNVVFWDVRPCGSCMNRNGILLSHCCGNLKACLEITWRDVIYSVGIHKYYTSSSSESVLQCIEVTWPIHVCCKKCMIAWINRNHSENLWNCITAFE